MWGMKKEKMLQVRLSEAEKAAFTEAAKIAGLRLSAWVCERLRLAARTELPEVGRPVAFLDEPR